MAKRLPPVNVVIVGMGWAGSILARELTRAGLRVVGLERGRNRVPSEDFALPAIRDELKYLHRHELFQDPGMETLTVRHGVDETALPMRRWAAFFPGDGVGGAGTHWGGQTFRFGPEEFALRSHLKARYGDSALLKDLPIQDWGLTYEELEPLYDRFEKLCGVSGQAGNLNGRKIAGGNVFEGPRQFEYPNKPLVQPAASQLFAKATAELGYHPFPYPAANMSAPYTNPEGLTMGQCQYCGHCGSFGCEANAKATPEVAILPAVLRDPNFELRTLAYVSRIVYDKHSRKARGVIYIDRRTGEECEQPADIVILASFTFNNTLLLLLSNIGAPYDPASGKGTVGRNYCAQLFSVNSLFFEDREFNPFISTGSLGTVIADFEGDNFDHGGLGFFGGGHISGGGGVGGPIGRAFALPPGSARWGTEWKRSLAKWYRRTSSLLCSGSNYPHRMNYLSLDPQYHDAIGRPLLRMTYNFRSNDHAILRHLRTKAEEIVRHIGPARTGQWSGNPSGNFDVRVGQTSHNSGGAIMGLDPSTSVVNPFLQSWAADNLFVVGASAFPQGSGHNPTGTVGALSYRAAQAITGSYLKRPGALVHA